MRLVQLKVRNIASLKGDHTIDFKEVESHSSLFAITGETGAGKSTILNAIGLSLYGEIYKKNVTQVDVVTLGEKEGQIELIFQVKGKHYLADWRAKVRKQNGEILKQPQIQRYLYEIEGDGPDSPKKVTTKETKELLHLDFDQFCKCIILNQGEFARFLSSSFTERKEILEKLYPGEMLESLSRELKLELETVQKVTEELDIELKTLKGDGPSGEGLQDDRNRLKCDLEAKEESSKKMEVLDYHFVSLSNYHTKYSENKKKLEIIKAELAHHTTKYNHTLKESQALAEKFIEAQKEQEFELPRLQGHLKSEERLTLLNQSRAEQTKKIIDYESKLLKTKQQLNTSTTTLDALDTKIREAQENFKFPLHLISKHQAKLEECFEIFSSRELKDQELKIKSGNLTNLEAMGKEIRENLNLAKLKLDSYPRNIKEEIEKLESKKTMLVIQHDKRQREIIQMTEVQNQMSSLDSEFKVVHSKIDELHINLKVLKTELAPIETTLKLESLMSAVEVCLTHPKFEETGTCPVCKTQIEKKIWQELHLSLGKNDLQGLKKRSENLSRQLIKSEEELKIFSEKEKNLRSSIEIKKSEFKVLEESTKILIPVVQKVEEELALLQKQGWEVENCVKEIQRLEGELNKSRNQYSELKTETNLLQRVLNENNGKLKALLHEVGELNLTDLNPQIVSELKADLKQLSSLKEIESRKDKFLQETNFLQKSKLDLENELSSLFKTREAQTVEIDKLSKDLRTHLGGNRASELIEKLQAKVKELTHTWNQSEQELKRKELELKDLQGRIYTHDEHTRDIDLQFSKELHAVKARAFMETEDEEIALLLNKLQNFELSLSSPGELFVPILDRLKEFKLKLKEETNILRMNFAAITERLKVWEKKQDRIQVQELKRAEYQEKLDRLSRLFEVLGKDELRTFVLSLVEENLIEQTNVELGRLCQGRYEIVHQSRRMRMTPEFYVLDKFREGGLRKVSTLSGGETFMVSLAMAIALAEMTRGQAEIDSLFIDEGFGTLDQDSLDDVLEMLGQIQTRGLMVGIISHIKSLTNAIPVNLVLSKKQDGTSSVSMLLN